MNQLPTSLVKFFWHFIRSYKGLVISLFAVGLFWSVNFSLEPYLLKMVIDTIATYTGDKADIFAAIKFPVIGYIVMWCLMAINFRIADWVKLQLFPNIRRDIITTMFIYLSHHSHSYLQNNFAGSLSNKIMDMAEGAASALTRMNEGIANLLACLIAIIVVYFVHPLFALILFTWAAMFLTITVLFSKNIKDLSRVFSESKSSLSGKIVDSVTNLSNMRLFARNAYESKNLNRAVDETVENDQAVQWYILKMRIFWDITFVTLIGSTLGSLVFLYSKGEVTVGDFVFIMTVALKIFMHVWNLAAQFVQFAEEVGRCSQALTIITAPHDIINIPNACELKVTEGNIKFTDVRFCYKRNNNLFENQNITIEAGTKVGLVGLSGSGKTTFVNLILRVFDIDSGEITIDDQNISQVTQDSLRENIAMIPQDASLFHRSVMENIRYGKLDATDSEVIAVAKLAHCHEFIELLPEGYDSLVGERGIKLSGGQRQRIAIARAMLKNAPILMLDEATSALDSITEMYIQESLQILMQDRTSIVIAHRLSTLKHMDRILVFNQGHVVEDGNHAELLKANGRYAEMWNMQAGGFLPEVE